MTRMGLTLGRLFTLRELAKGNSTGFAISREAMKSGLNTRATGMMEWADAHLRRLRMSGLAETTGVSILGCSVHRITEAGRQALKEIA